VLPAAAADNSHIGIMSILYNNIGKDLSRISMPVALNEPLSLLQRVSEELEYSELLDVANLTEDPYERMVGSRGSRGPLDLVYIWPPSQWPRLLLCDSCLKGRPHWSSLFRDASSPSVS